MQFSSKLLWPLGILTALCLSVGIIWGFFFTPDDYQQGATVKLLYIHVPSALMAINAWFMMLVGSLIDDVDCAGDRCDLGPAYVGNLVGVGPAFDQLFDPVCVLLGLYGALGRDRGSG